MLPGKSFRWARKAAKQYTSESQAYYAATLYDIIYGQESKDCYFKYFDQSYKMFQISMWKDVNELAEEVYMQGITDKTVLNDDVMAALGAAQISKTVWTSLPSSGR